jgi:hypothetical protein
MRGSSDWHLRRYPITNAFRKIGLSGEGREEQRPDPAAERAAGHRGGPR